MFYVLFYFFNNFVAFFFFFFFFNDTATTEIYTLSLHDALPISRRLLDAYEGTSPEPLTRDEYRWLPGARSEEHTSELQSHHDLVCRLLLEKKKNNIKNAKADKHKRNKHTK